MDYTSPGAWAWVCSPGCLLWALLLAAMQVSGVRLTRGQLGGVALATAAALVYFCIPDPNTASLSTILTTGHYYQKQIAYELLFYAWAFVRAEERF